MMNLFSNQLMQTNLPISLLSGMDSSTVLSTPSGTVKHCIRLLLVFSRRLMICFSRALMIMLVALNSSSDRCRRTWRLRLNSLGVLWPHRPSRRRLFRKAWLIWADRCGVVDASCLLLIRISCAPAAGHHFRLRVSNVLIAEDLLF